MKIEKADKNQFHIPKGLKIFTIIILCLLVLAMASIPVSSLLFTYQPTDRAMQAIEQPESDYSVQFLQNDVLLFKPKDKILNIDAGVVIYPGALVDYKAYASLAKKLSQKGVTVVIAKFPCNYAFLDINACDDIIQAIPEVNQWFLAGHSLGGSMASYYISRRIDNIDGFILLASFSTKDLSNIDIPCLSIYGSKDAVLNRSQYEACRDNFPKNLTEYVINGGCHAYFGDYGRQNGDGEPTITLEEQENQTVDQIIDWIIKETQH